MAKELINYLNSNGLEYFCNEYSVKAARHNKYSNLVLLKYDQINSPMNVEMVQICRGIILDENKNWSVVSRSYDKFFNYGEGKAKEINWSTANILEKLDGSLHTLFFYDNKWQVCTLGLPDASGNVYSYDFTFADLFWKTWNDLNYELPDANIFGKFSFMFELMTPFNTVVIKHERPRLVLHGLRNNDPEGNYCEYLPSLCGSGEIWEHKNWEIVKHFSINNLNECLECVNKLDGTQQEGFVICDNKFRRLKIKNPLYVSIHHLKNNFCKKRILEIVCLNEDDELLTYFPEYKDSIIEVRDKYNEAIFNINETFEKYRNIEDKKEFALKVKDLLFSGIYFGLKNNKISSIKEAFIRMNINDLMINLEIKD